jgi:hypothetical protein
MLSADRGRAGRVRTRASATSSAPASATSALGTAVPCARVPASRRPRTVPATAPARIVRDRSSRTPPRALRAGLPPPRSRTGGTVARSQGRVPDASAGVPRSRVRDRRAAGDTDRPRRRAARSGRGRAAPTCRRGGAADRSTARWAALERRAERFRCAPRPSTVGTVAGASRVGASRVWPGAPVARSGTPGGTGERVPATGVCGAAGASWRAGRKASGSR